MATVFNDPEIGSNLRAAAELLQNKDITPEQAREMSCQKWVIERDKEPVNSWHQTLDI